MKTFIRILSITTFILLLILAVIIFLPLDLGIPNFYTNQAVVPDNQDEIDNLANRLILQENRTKVLNIYLEDLLRRFREAQIYLEEME